MVISRQSFLGLDSEKKLAEARIAIIGLGGGGSHIAQQLAHIGIGHCALIDPDYIDPEGTNLNRLVGATKIDVKVGTSKVAIAARVVLGVNPEADVAVIRKPWTEVMELIRDYEVIVGCVDTFRGRQELERAARRFHIAYVDIGMDVYDFGSHHGISGQVFLSLPGELCMTCFGLLREDFLAKEASEYGAAGPRQQVVWPNGVLASTAVGLIVALITPWYTPNLGPTLLEYDGNLGTLTQSSRIEALAGQSCPHFSHYDDIGDPLLVLTATEGRIE